MSDTRVAPTAIQSELTIGRRCSLTEKTELQLETLRTGGKGSTDQVPGGTKDIRMSVACGASSSAVKLQPARAIRNPRRKRRRAGAAPRMEPATSRRFSLR